MENPSEKKACTASAIFSENQKKDRERVNGISQPYISDASAGESSTGLMTKVGAIV